MGLDQYVYSVKLDYELPGVDFDDIKGANRFCYWGRQYWGIFYFMNDLYIKKCSQDRALPKAFQNIKFGGVNMSLTEDDLEEFHEQFLSDAKYDSKYENDADDETENVQEFYDSAKRAHENGFQLYYYASW